VIWAGAAGKAGVVVPEPEDEDDDELDPQAAKVIPNVAAVAKSAFLRNYFPPCLFTCNDHLMEDPNLPWALRNITTENGPVVCERIFFS
jgi:hypothetical protein